MQKHYNMLGGGIYARKRISLLPFTSWIYLPVWQHNPTDTAPSTHTDGRIRSESLGSWYLLGRAYMTIDERCTAPGSAAID